MEATAVNGVCNSGVSYQKAIVSSLPFVGVAMSIVNLRDVWFYCCIESPVTKLENQKLELESKVRKLDNEASSCGWKQLSIKSGIGGLGLKVVAGTITEAELEEEKEKIQSELDNLQKKQESR